MDTQDASFLDPNTLSLANSPTQKQMLSEIQSFQQELSKLYAGLADIEAAGELILRALKNGKKLITCGNGGSAADAQHIAAELTGRFFVNRPAIPALALNVDTSALTAIGNDFGFEYVFSRQLEALGQAGDVLLAITTSGNSPNILNALKMAQQKKVSTILLTGKDGGEAFKHNLSNKAIIVPSQRTDRIQQMHILIGHLWCGLAEAAACE